MTPTTKIDDSSFSIEIPLGIPSHDRDFALIQFGVMVVGLTFLLPDFRLFRFGLDGSLIIRSAFAALFTAIGVIVSIRGFAFPPTPIRICFRGNDLQFDSGRAGLRYLGDFLENDLSRLYSTLFQRRRTWTIKRAEIQSAPCTVITEGHRLLVRTAIRTYDLGIGIPDSLQSTVRDSLVAWIV